MKRGQLFDYMKKIFLSYFLAIGIPVCVLTGIFLNTSIQQSREWEDARTRRTVQLAQSQIGGFIERAYDFVNITATGNDLRKIQKESYAQSVYYYRQLLSSMQSFASNNGDHVNVSLYVRNSDKILSTDDGVCSLEEGKEKDLIKSFLRKETPGELCRDGNSLVLLTVLPFYYYTDSVVFLFYFDVSSIEMETESPISIVASDGTLLFDNGLNEENCQFFAGSLPESSGRFAQHGQEGWYAHENQSGAVFVSLYNQEELRLTIFKTVLITAAVLLASLLAVCGIAYGMTRHYTSPVQKLAHQIRQMPAVSKEKGTGEKEIFASIQSFIDELYHQNQAYRTSVEQNSRMIKDNALRDLLWCRIPTNCSVQNYLRKAGFEKIKSLFVPVLIRISAISEKGDIWKNTELSVLIQNILTEHLEEFDLLLGTTSLETDQILVILHGEKEEWQKVDLAQEMKEQVDFVGRQLGITLQVITGYPVSSSEELCRQFVGMRRKIYLTPENRQTVSTITSEAEGEDGLPVWLKTSLLNAVRSGDEYLVREIFSQLQELQKDCRNTSRLENYLLGVFGNILIHLMDSPVQISPDRLDFLGVFLSEASREQKLETLQQRMLEVCACFQKNEKKSENVHVQKAVKYIHDNLGKELSLGEIAEHVGINTSYLIRVFKSEMGDTPLQYLTALRMEKAKELLENSRLTVKQISEQLGYNDMRSFVRFFKKAEGCTPNEYRDTVTNK